MIGWKELLSFGEYRATVSKILASNEEVSKEELEVALFQQGKPVSRKIDEFLETFSHTCTVTIDPELGFHVFPSRGIKRLLLTAMAAFLIVFPVIAINSADTSETIIFVMAAFGGPLLSIGIPSAFGAAYFSRCKWKVRRHFRA